MDNFQRLATKTLKAELMRLRTLQIEHPTSEREVLIAAHELGLRALNNGGEASRQKINGPALQSVLDTQNPQK